MTTSLERFNIDTYVCVKLEVLLLLLVYELAS